MKVGDLVRIINMRGEPQYNMKVGTVTHIDDIGQIHGTWGGCAIIPEEDDYEIAKTCCLCGKKFFGFGNNAQPLKDGICCNDCNNNVILARLMK